jgi:hypothetical protein
MTPVAAAMSRPHRLAGPQHIARNMLKHTKQVIFGEWLA